MYWLPRVNERDFQSYGMGVAVAVAKEPKDRESVLTGFKRTLDLVAPYFAGYQQHDAQEVRVVIFR